jgi:uncharacterized membrane protein
MGEIKAEFRLNQCWKPAQWFIYAIILQLGGCVAQPDKPAASSTLPQAQAWNCDKLGYVVSAHRDSPSNLWLFLPETTLQLQRSTTNAEQGFTAGSTSFYPHGNSADLQYSGTTYSCFENRKASIREDAKLRGVDFWATGNEPPWQLELNTEQIIVKTGYESSRHIFTGTTPGIDANDEGTPTTLYQSENASQKLSVWLTGAPCVDSMSGEQFPTQVEIRMGTMLLRGCGRPLH